MSGGRIQEILATEGTPLGECRLKKVCSPILCDRYQKSPTKEAPLNRFIKVSAIIVAVSFASSNAQAGACEWAAGGIAAAGTAVASASSVAAAAGVAAVKHASGAAIATSIGTGGAGYIAGTLGTIGAAALSAVSAPAVIATAAGVAVVGGGTAAYCYFAR